MSDVVRAAGGIPVRGRRGDVEVVVVHRPRYEDWTLPKGRCEPDETDEACAVREVEEETGLVCTPGQELPSTSYVDGRGRPKRVRYWTMTVSRGEARPAPPEIDEVRWVALDEARRLLTYERDRALLDDLLAARGYSSSRRS